MRSVERLNKDTGEVLGIYDSSLEAEEWLKENEYKGNVSGITACCRGKHKTAGGFKWRYQVVVDLPKEEWREIPGYKDYSASNEGRVKYMMSLKLQYDNDGYKNTWVMGKNCKVHRLVALAFIPNPDNLPEVDHIDKDRSNNRLSNLRWVSSLDNVTHSLGKRVAKCDMDGNVIEEFRSMNEAARSLDKTGGASHICRVCNGTPDSKGHIPIKAYGFSWKFV